MILSEIMCNIKNPGKNIYYIHHHDFCTYLRNKDENVQRFALSAIRGELLERERERKIQIINEIEIDTHLFVK